jgi:Transposase DDE domain
MRLPREAYPIQEALTVHLPTLRPAQVRGLTWWVYGAILAGSACQTAILVALRPLGATAALHQRLREWLYDGADTAVPSPYQVDVAGCFPWLLRWLLGWWQGRDLALALDATMLGDRLVVLSLSVLYRGTALPVAWHVLPANRPGAWGPCWQGLLAGVAPAIPLTMRVLVLTDRGLWSPHLWDGIRTLGWSPLMRVRQETTVRPIGQQRVAATRLVPGPGHAWIGAATLYRQKTKQRRGTVLVVWDHEQAEPWILVTSLPARRVGAWWYALRTWIELGFRALKRLGWPWERTRRTAPARVARHWLVLAVATLWVVATGTRVEDAAAVGRAPATLHRPPAAAVVPGPRAVSLFTLGLYQLRWQLLRLRRLWTRLWLRPAPWPDPPPHLAVVVVDPRAGPLPT